jgi:hypothetical protein
VDHLEFLAGLHRLLDRPTYLEIGAGHGDSLALARGRAVGIDPVDELRVELRDDAKLYRETSDEYFARKQPRAPLGGRRVALAFIDGRHLAEFAVRDFANVERHAEWTSVVVVDGVLPPTAEAAALDRRTSASSGDVYKLLDVLAEHRPDLTCLRVDTQPSGLGVVLGLDPESTVLTDRYDAIVRALVTPDPQNVPAEVLGRAGALEPEAVLASSVWSLLRRGREAGAHRGLGLRRLHRRLRRDLGVSAPRRRDERAAHA